MPKIFLTCRNGITKSMEVQSGPSLMDAIRESGVDELLALCSGACACATCHVYISGIAASHLPPMSRDENDLLNGSEHRASSSRLSCQIPIDDRLDGMAVTVAPDSAAG